MRKRIRLKTAAIVLPPGSCRGIPGDLPPVSKRLSEIGCVTFLDQDGRLDFPPVTK